jgi:hypothetical protein
MTSQGNGPPIPYQISMSQVVRATLKQLHQEAAQAGTGPQVVAAYREIIERLRRDPPVWVSRSIACRPSGCSSARESSPLSS